LGDGLGKFEVTREIFWGRVAFRKGFPWSFFGESMEGTVDCENAVDVVLDTLGVEGADYFVRVCRRVIEDYPAYSGVFFTWVWIADGEVSETIDVVQ
jgi:hypothetical protein